MASGIPVQKVLPLLQLLQQSLTMHEGHAKATEAWRRDCQTTIDDLTLYFKKHEQHLKERQELLEDKQSIMACLSIVEAAKEYVEGGSGTSDGPIVNHTNEKGADDSNPRWTMV
ncbi:Hypothetical protein D9617_49g041270 [Elsinoe fawcettii]|nr:Hypothetical protein D9617_49g041270 [Elsinoe fawcettii]